jgi:inhibitor of cysteine peptidase
MKTLSILFIFTAVCGLICIAVMALVPVYISDTDNGKTIEVLRFRAIRVALESNPTTGYSWQVVSPAGREVLRLYYSAYRHSASRLLGSGGTQEFKFRPMARGTATIKAVYTRPWEHAATAGREFSVTIRVR